MNNETWGKQLPDAIRRSVAKALQSWFVSMVLPSTDETETKTLDIGKVIALQKDLAGGYSEAKVLLVDIHPEGCDADFGTFEHGQYILKVEGDRGEASWNAGPTEAERHKISYARNIDFSSQHIPRLTRSGSYDGNIVLLYEVAGGGLAFAVTAESLFNANVGAFEALIRCLAWSLLAEFNALYRYEPSATAQDVLHLWLGYRLDLNLPKSH